MLSFRFSHATKQEHNSPTHCTYPMFYRCGRNLLMAWHNSIQHIVLWAEIRAFCTSGQLSGLCKFLSKIGNEMEKCAKKSVSQSVSAFKLQTMMIFLLLTCQVLRSEGLFSQVRTATLYATSVRLYKGSDM